MYMYIILHIIHYTLYITVHYYTLGIMGFLMSDTREARLLRKHLVFKISKSLK